MAKSGPKEAEWKGFVAGALAGAVEATVNYPTEFVKTQLQLRKGVYKGPVHCIQLTFAEKGFFGFYKGVSSLVVGTMFKSAIRFGSYDMYAARLKGDADKLSTGKTMIAGLLTGITEAIFAVTPTETIKTKLIDDTNRKEPRYKGMVHGVRTIVAEEGLTGVYKGLSATIARQAMNSCVRFTVYGFLKDMLLSRKKEGPKVLSAAESTFSGFMAGSINVYVTMPLDVVKTRMQGLSAHEYNGMLDCFKQIIQKEGPLALWKGSIPRLVRLAPSGGIMFLVYEQVMKVLNTIA